jgi:hypothetical protein
MTDNKQEYVPASDRPDVTLNPEQRGRMNHAKLLLLVCLASLSACGSGAQPNEGDAVSSLTAPGGDQCALVSPATLDELDAIMATGQFSAEQDVALNAAGTYGAAAEGGLRGLTNARARLAELRSYFHTDADGHTVADAGYNVETYLGYVIEQLHETIHWSAISEIYNQIYNQNPESHDARDAVEAALQGIETANNLQASGVRCYMDQYMN